MRPGWVRRCAMGGALALAGLAAGPMAAAPTVFPTGTTIYQPDKTWNGFTVLSPLGTPAVIVVDMNGRVVKRWDGFDLVSGGPARVLPGGVVIAPQGDAMPQHLEARALVAEDFAGKELWRYDHGEETRPRRQARMERPPASRLAAGRLPERGLLAAIHPGARRRGDAAADPFAPRRSAPSPTSDSTTTSWSSSTPRER